MKPPAKIVVGPFDYAVTLEEMDEPAALGRTNCNLSTIKLDSRQSDSILRGTALHEVLHACVAATALPSADFWTEAAEEAVVRALEPVLLDVLRRNPKLVAFLLA
jgi:hypothetical protein